MSDGGTISGATSISRANTRSGLAFNVQDSESFYQVRIQGETGNVQFFRSDNGSAANVVSTTLPASQVFSLNTFYTISVTNNNAATDNITYTISGPDITTYSNTVTDTTWTDGFGGFVAGNTSPTQGEIFQFDDFSATANP